jgi:hypothetical protein
MRKIAVLCLSLILLPGWNAWSQGRSEKGSKGRSGGGQRAAARAPVVINMNHGSSGGHNHNFPSQQPSYGHISQSHSPSYSPIGGLNPSPVRSREEKPSNGAIRSEGNEPASKTFNQPRQEQNFQQAQRPAVVVHHHAYSQGYVRQKLQKLGVHNEPNLITDRMEMIETDRAHSAINYPKFGADHQALNASLVSPRHFNDSVVRDEMGLVDRPDFQSRIEGYNNSEILEGHYYWHNDGGLVSCHYRDASGYNWYGYYAGNQYFWTRNYNGRTWWYDSQYNRWNFWNNGFWWWQDPYHVGDLYCYNNDSYIPCNSAEDQIAVTAPEGGDQQNFTSPDGNREVRLMTANQDAYLYDTRNPASFSPVYMASGVQSVQFSDPGNGRAPEIILKLNDGSFDMFDEQGNPYNTGAGENLAYEDGSQPQDAYTTTDSTEQKMDKNFDSPWSPTTVTEP